jgi:hypothetical protein
MARAVSLLVLRMTVFWRALREVSSTRMSTSQAWGVEGGRLGGLDVVEEDDGVWGLEVLVDEGGELVELEDVCSEDLKMREKRDEFGESWRVEGGLGLGLIGGWDAPLSNYRRA